MMRWFDELFNPKLKCERLGHNMQNIATRVYLYPSKSYRGVADEAIEIVPTCSRCGHTEAMTIKTERTLNGLTMNGDRWDALERDGRLVQ